jgi:hypothetical protein
MVSKTIDKNRLKIKYIIGSYQHLPGYPTAEDLFYDMLTEYCSRKEDRRLKFTTTMIERKYPHLSAEKTAEHTAHLEQIGLIREVNRTSAFTSFQIERNPYS